MKLLIVFATLMMAISAQSNQTPNYWKAYNCVGGEWNFGRAPKACDARTFGEDLWLKENYPKLLFSDLVSRTPERDRYMTEMNSVLEATVTYYFDKRKPSASQAERQAFMTAIKVIAGAESYWSHYRVGSDSRYKIMRGDYGHGFGIMQVDDRAHFRAIEQGIGWELTQHYIYAMDIFFAQWERWPQALCYTRMDDYYSRTRSAWAAYNGGPSQLCRWTNPNHTWSKNDRNFKAALDSQSFKKFVKDPKLASSVNVRCMAEESFPCQHGAPEEPLPPVEPPVLPPVSGTSQFVQIDSSACEVMGEIVECLPLNDAICLNPTAKDLTEFKKMPASSAQQIQSLNRFDTCRETVTHLSRVGQFIKLQVAINLRSTPAGALNGSVPKGAVVQVLGFEHRNFDLLYYLVQYNGKSGYIYAGNRQTHPSWAVRVTPSSSQRLAALLADKGTFLRILNSVGINMRQTPAGTLLQLIPRSTQLEVLDIAVQGAEQKIYFKVRYGGREGYIYGGMLTELWSIAQWTKPI